MSDFIGLHENKQSDPMCCGERKNFLPTLVLPKMLDIFPRAASFTQPLFKGLNRPWITPSAYLYACCFHTPWKGGVLFTGSW